MQLEEKYLSLWLKHSNHKEIKMDVLYLNTVNGKLHQENIDHKMDENFRSIFTSLFTTVSYFNNKLNGPIKHEDGTILFFKNGLLTEIQLSDNTKLKEVAIFIPEDDYNRRLGHAFVASNLIDILHINIEDNEERKFIQKMFLQYFMDIFRLFAIHKKIKQNNP